MVTARDVLAGAEPGAIREQRPDFGLVVGVDHYAQIRTLRGAVEDARDFYAWMRDDEGGGVAREHAVLIESCLQPPPPTPLQETVDDALVQLLETANARGGGRRLYFHFSGHGAMHRLESGSDVALLLARWSAIFNRVALSSDGYSSQLAGAGMFEEIAIFLDCCRSDAIGAVGVRPSFTTASFPRRSPTRVFLAYATEAGGQAFEGPGEDGWHGVFTRSLLSILRTSPRGVSAHVLKTKLEDQLDRYNQHAHVMNGFVADSMFGTRGELPELEVVFRRARGVVWLFEDAVLLAEHHTGAGPWRLRLPPGLYKLENAIAGDKVFEHLPGGSHVEL